MQEACYTSSASVGFPASGLNTWLCPFHILACAGKFLSVPSQICIFSEIILHTPYTAALTCLKGVDADTDVACDCVLYRPLGNHQSSNLQSLLIWVGFKPDVKACML